MIRFSKYIWFYFIISAFVIVPGIFSFMRWGLKPSIDFTGGTLVEVRLPSKDSEAVVNDLVSKAHMVVASRQRSDQSILLRMKSEESSKVAQFATMLNSVASPSPTIIRDETVGPVLGTELLHKALAAAALAIIAILLYIAYAFKNIKYGVAAVVALVHDVLVVIGSFAIFGHFMGVEVDTLFVTAVLTTMSFSVHDTIVVFDRIREYQGKHERVSFEELCDQALTETLGRSMTNSFTIIFMLLALTLMGGESVRWFVVALLVGTTSGAYSSPFIATPMLLLWDRWEKRKNKRA